MITIAVDNKRLVQLVRALKVARATGALSDADLVWWNEWLANRDNKMTLITTRRVTRLRLV